MTLTATQDAAISTVTVQLNAARVVSGLAHGEIQRTYVERLDVLMCRLRTHKRAGRERAALACRRMVEQLLDEMETA